MEAELWFVLPLVIVVLTSSSLALVFVLRRLRPSASTGKMISLLMVERLARAAQRRGGLLAAVGLVGVPTAMLMELQRGGSLLGLSAIVATIVACIGVRAFCVGRAVLTLVEHSGRSLTAELEGGTVILRHGDAELHFGVSRWALAGVRRDAVPRSIARVG